MELYERQFEAEFVSNKPTDVIWLDREKLSHRLRFFCHMTTCVYCKKEIHVLSLYSMIDKLDERLRGKICPNCNMVGLRR